MDELIETVRQHKAIYDTKCKDYKNQSIRNCVWEEIGVKIKQPPSKCKDDWTKLRNAYVNAIKRRKSKKKGQAATNITPWRYEEQMSFLQPYMESRPKEKTLSNLSPPQSPELEDTQEVPEEYDDESAPGTPLADSFTQSQSKKRRNRTSSNNSIQDMYNLMKSSHDLRLQKQNTKQDMDETDLFFLSMSKALKVLPKLDQTKIKLDLHKAISEAEIRQLQTPSLPRLFLKPQQLQLLQHFPQTVPQKQFQSQQPQQAQPSDTPSTSKATVFQSRSPCIAIPTTSSMQQSESTLCKESDRNDGLAVYYADTNFSDENDTD